MSGHRVARSFAPEISELPRPPPRDPAIMSPRESVHEIAAILARGWRRLSESSRNCLEVAPPGEAPSCETVNGTEDRAVERTT